MAFLPQQEETTMSTTTYLVFKLNRNWSNKTLKILRKFYSFLFSDNQRYLSHMTVDVVEKVPCIKFLIPNSKQVIEDLISEVAKKRQFMYLLGMFEMMISDIPVLIEDENNNFTFESALQKATEFGNNEAVQFLQDLSNVDRTHNESKPFSVASDPGHLLVDTTSLLNNPNAMYDENGYPKLIYASENDMYQMVEILLKNGADPNIRDDDGGTTALMVASKSGHQQVVEILLNNRADPNIQNEDGTTALIEASENGHYQVVEILLKNGADPNIQAEDESTALILASIEGHSDIIEVLLRYNANPHYFVSDEGVLIDSFACAAANGNIECVNIFLKHTELSLKSLSMGWYCACVKGHAPIIRLLSNRLDIFTDQRDLIISCAEGDLGSVVDQLMSGKITPEVQFVHGVTPIILSSSCGHTEIVEALITAGANVNKIDEFGHTALDFTEEAEQDATRYILLQHGAIEGPGPESDEEETTTEEQKLSTDTSQSTIKSSQDSLPIRKNTKKRPFFIMKKLFKDTVKYSQSIVSPHQRFDNREYSTTTNIP